jgi:hypothetical protein
MGIVYSVLPSFGQSVPANEPHEAKCDEPKPHEAKCDESKPHEAKYDEPNHVETNQVEQNHVELNQVEQNHVEPNQVESTHFKSNYIVHTFNEPIQTIVTFEDSKSAKLTCDKSLIFSKENVNSTLRKKSTDLLPDEQTDTIEASLIQLKSIENKINKLTLNENMNSTPKNKRKKKIQLINMRICKDFDEKVDEPNYKINSNRDFKESTKPYLR